MRHIGSFLLAAVFCPAIFLLTGTGLSAFESARRHAFADDPVAPLAALGALLLAGLLYGILIMVRLSPVGPGLAGMVLFGLSTWALVSPTAYDAQFERLGIHMGGAVGQWGLGFLLGVPLLATFTSPRRWRKLPYGGDVYYVAPSTVDATRRMPAQAAYVAAPDVAAPLLHYPPAAPPPPARPAPPPLPTRTARPAPEPPPAVIAAPATPPTTPAVTPPSSPPAGTPEPPTVPVIVAPIVPPPAAPPAFSHAAQPESPPPPAVPPPATPSFSHGDSASGDDPTATLEP